MTSIGRLKPVAIRLPLHGVIRGNFAAFLPATATRQLGKNAANYMNFSGGPNGTRYLLYCGIPRGYQGCLAQLNPGVDLKALRHAGLGSAGGVVSEVASEASHGLTSLALQPTLSGHGNGPVNKPPATGSRRWT